VRIVDLLERDAAIAPDKPAVVVVGGTTLTYAALRRRAAGLAAGLAARGVRKGDRVVVMAGNSTTPFDTYLACAYLGAAAVPIGTRLTGPEIEYIVEDAEPAAAFADPDHGELLAKTLPGGIDLVATDDAAYADLLRSGDDPGDDHGAEAEDVALIIYTSGTTGRPKGVCLTQANLCANALTMAVAQAFRPDDVFLSMTPIYHAATGTRVSSMLVDAQTHVVLPSFDEEGAIGAISEHGVTTTIAVPTQLRRILDAPGFDPARLASMRLLVYGAAPTGLPLIRRAMTELPCGLYQGYGLTEGTTNLTGLLPSDHTPDTPDERLSSAGRPVVGTRLSLRDEDGEPVRRGEPGEIWVRSDKVMAGYWRNPQATGEAIVDGWLRTGDVGRLDDGGYLSIVDRAKDMLISGGVNVYPSEIEAVLRQWPGLGDVAVVGQPDDEWGEVPVAYVMVEGGTALDTAALQAFCRKRLAGLKVPRTVHVVDEFPRTATGKIRKVELRSRSRAAAEGGP
jgi:fatty-acyl-CoA synthase